MLRLWNVKITMPTYRSDITPIVALVATQNGTVLPSASIRAGTMDTALAHTTLVLGSLASRMGMTIDE
jgi:hypothetical protein